MAKHLWAAAKEVANIERLTDPVHQKIVKTSIQKEMFKKNIFCWKCCFGVIGTSDESSWKAS